MGRPCWLLVPRIGADWRWLAETEAARWYASVTVIRQAAPGSWAPEMAALREALEGTA
jgi:hypothetical protein